MDRGEVISLSLSEGTIKADAMLVWPLGRFMKAMRLKCPKYKTGVGFVNSRSSCGGRLILCWHSMTASTRKLRNMIDRMEPKCKILDLY